MFLLLVWMWGKQSKRLIRVFFSLNSLTEIQMIFVDFLETRSESLEFWHNSLLYILWIRTHFRSKTDLFNILYVNQRNTRSQWNKAPKFVIYTNFMLFNLKTNFHFSIFSCIFVFTDMLTTKGLYGTWRRISQLKRTRLRDNMHNNHQMRLVCKSIPDKSQLFERKNTVNIRFLSSFEWN